MRRGVGLVIPAGIAGFDGHVFDLSVDLESVLDKHGQGSPEFRDAMARRYGPRWSEGRGSMHSSDHAAALRKIWSRAQQHGLSTDGILQFDGAGFDGQPTVTEITTSHLWMLPTPSPVLSAAHTMLPFEYGYGQLPLDEPLDRMDWPTEWWRLALTTGSMRSMPRKFKTTAFAQLDLIEAGLVPGWARAYIGGWRRTR